MKPCEHDWKCVHSDICEAVLWCRKCGALRTELRGTDPVEYQCAYPDNAKGGE